jgi:hypothetical protein
MSKWVRGGLEVDAQRCQRHEYEIIIQYDTTMTSSTRTAAIAIEHCKQFGRSAEPVDAAMPVVLLGIIEEKPYSCVPAWQATNLEDKVRAEKPDSK